MHPPITFVPGIDILSFVVGTIYFMLVVLYLRGMCSNPLCLMLLAAFSLLSVSL